MIWSSQGSGICTPEIASTGALFSGDANKLIRLGDANLLATRKAGGKFSEPQLFQGLATVQDDHRHLCIFTLQSKQSESCKSAIVQRIEAMSKPIDAQWSHITGTNPSVAQSCPQTQDVIRPSSHGWCPKLPTTSRLAETQVQGI
jgi:hypothetical protein